MRRLVGVALLAGMLGLVLPGAVSAHALFVSALPGPGDRLAGPPATVRMVFSEPLNGRLSGIDVFDSTGRNVFGSGEQVDPADTRAYLLRLPLLSADRYTVLWHTTSLVDGHTRQGSYTFTVLRPDGSLPSLGTAAINAPRIVELPDWANAAAKWLALFGLFLLAGPVLLRLIVPQGEPVDSIRVNRPLALLSATGIVLLILGSAGQLLGILLLAGAPNVARALLGSSFGVWWIVRVGASLSMTLSGSLQPAAAKARRLDAWLDRVLVAVIVLSFAATSHGAASARGGWGAAFDLVHLLAAIFWIGGLFAVAAIFRHPAQTAAGRAYRQLVLARFSILAGMAVPAVLLSGVASGLIELGSIRDLVATAYGTSLLIKLVLVGALLRAAAANAFLLRPAFQSRRPLGDRIRWTIAAEALLGIAVVVVAAAMSVQPPARDLDQVRAVSQRLAANENPSSAFSGYTEIDGRQVEVTLTPAEIGINHLAVEIEGTLAESRLEVLLIGPDAGRGSATLQRTGTTDQPDGRLRTSYEGALQLEGVKGDWNASIVLPDRSSSGAELILPIAAATTDAGAATRSAPAVGWLVALAAAIAVAVAAAATRALPIRTRRSLLIGLAATGAVAALSAGIVLAATAIPHGSRSSSVPTQSIAPQVAWGTTTAVAPRTLSAGVQLWTIPTPRSGLMPPAIGPDGSVWVSEMDTNKLARLMPKDNTIRELDYGKTYKGTMGIAIDLDGILWLAQGSASAIGRFDPASGSYTEFATPASKSDPTGIAVDRTGIVWFTELGADKIGRFDPRDRAFKEFTLATPSATPYWVAVAPDGRVWFTEFAGQLGVLDPATEQITEYPTPARQRPAGIAIDPSGTVWSGTLEGSIISLAAGSSELVEQKSPGGGIYGVAVARDGTVWAGTTGATVYSLDPASGAFRIYALPPDSGSWWPASSADGGVWVTLGRAEVNALAFLRASPDSAVLPVSSGSAERAPS